MEESISWVEMPEELREAVSGANPGKLIGPLEIDETWYLVQVDDFVPAELDEDLQAQLEAEIFEQWLNQKVAAMTIKVQVKDD